MPSTSLKTRYLKRLHLEDVLLPTENILNAPPPTFTNLQRIQEHHLKYITFDNLAQHDGGIGRGPAVLDVEQTAIKILDEGRGGFCFELNTLLGALLEELGYAVKYVPAIVYSPEVGFRDQFTHVILIVSGCTDCDGSDGSPQDKSKSFVVDVGFGEPPLHPLNYGMLSGEEQRTPEGMRSKLEKTNGDGDNVLVTLYWYLNGEWKPRLKWSYTQSLTGVASLSELAPGLAYVQQPGTNFAQKLICTRLTRDCKFTLAGNRFKVTGPPRFRTNESDRPYHAMGEQVVTTLDSVDQVRKVLQDTFGIPLSQTTGLTLDSSLRKEAESTWETM